MKLLRLAGTTALALSMLLWAGCGSSYRPVVNPILPPGPNPQAQTFGLVLNQDPASGSAAVAEIDLTGDTSFWNQQVGNAPVNTPVHVGILGLQAFVANQAGDSITAFALGASQPAVNNLPVGANPTFVLPVSTSSSTGSITAVSVNTAGTGYMPGDKLTITQSGASGGVVRVESVSFNGTVSTSTGAIGPIVAVSIDAGGSGYTVASGLATTPITGSGTGALINITAVGGTGNVYVANFSDNTVSVIDATLFPPQVVATIPLTGGSGPIAMAASKDGSKVYVANRVSGDVSVITTASNTAPPSTITLTGSTPVAIVTNTDSGLIYVYSADGSIYVIDPTSTATTLSLAATATQLAAGSPCRVTPPSAPCQPMAFDSRSQRLYVADGNSTVSVFSTSGTTLGTPLSAPTLTALPNPTMVAPLPDGSRAYVLNAGATTSSPCGATSGTGQISVFNVTSNQVTKCVQLTPPAPVAIAASADSTRVLVPHQGKVTDTTSGNVTLPVGTTIITTANDTVVTDLPGPPVDPNCIDASTQNFTCTRMNPVAVLTSH